MKYIVTLLFLFSSFSFCLAQEDNDRNGGVRISFGNEYVEPQTFSGDDPNIPPKPKRTFSTNSIILNQILQECENFESLITTMEKFQNSGQITIIEKEECADCFTIYYLKEGNTVEAVMDKGNGKRANLLDNQFITTDKFTSKTYEAIRFQINE